MVITNHLLDCLTKDAKANERLRVNYDLRNSSDDQSQRMLNALEPGTKVPIHRHRSTSETVAVIRGAVRQNFYDDNANIIESFEIHADAQLSFFVVPKDSWHNTEALISGTIIFEAKDGAYHPLTSDEILTTL